LKTPPDKKLCDIAVHCSYDEAVDVVSLVSHPKNSNAHGEKQVALLARVIKAQGWRSPITVSRKSGFIVAGHGRLEAAKVLNVEKVPVDYQNFKTEADELAHLLADNRIAELSDLDLRGASKVFEELKAIKFDVDLTGFEEADFAKLLGLESAPEDFPEVDEDIDTNHKCPKCGYEWSGQIK
jgi:ParB-like chromosome segregation protein Spo0J